MKKLSLKEKTKALDTNLIENLIESCQCIIYLKRTFKRRKTTALANFQTIKSRSNTNFVKTQKKNW